MRPKTLFWVVVLDLAGSDLIQAQQVVLKSDDEAFGGAIQKEPHLKGRFLHITDIHPDPYYQIYSSTEEGIACHRPDGPAGYYGAETSDCDSPFSLVNATFKWIEDNLKDSVDFVIWTGDSARHDNDDHIPRSQEQVVGQNKFLVDKFAEVWRGDDKHSRNRFSIPIIPTIGNNDILPHNIFDRGPNEWTKAYSRVWHDLIPEEQRHAFDRGGWFYVEVIPNKLAVFSLNTMYFFGSNAAVDGCASPKEPGYEHFEWLRIQLQFLRERGVKAIMSGHVPPARSDEKTGWDETCWQKYALWMRQYRDVVIGAVYGHMNLEHFVLQDAKDIDLDVASGYKPPEYPSMEKFSGDVEIQINEPDYLNSLRELWSDLPYDPEMSLGATKKKKKSKQEKFFEKIGGEWAERFSASLISASVVPNYFPTLRVFEYNITGLESLDTDSTQSKIEYSRADEIREGNEHADLRKRETDEDTTKKRKQKKKPKKPNFTIPDPPPESAPIGPAYSPQTLSWLGYIQYYANLTHINNDFVGSESSDEKHSQSPPDDNFVDTVRWKKGKYHDKTPKKKKPEPRNFTFEVEYNTRDDGDVYGFSPAMTVRALVDLAGRIGEYKPNSTRSRLKPRLGGLGDPALGTAEGESEKDVDAGKKKKKRGKNRGKKQRKKLVKDTWYTFVSRALVATLDDDEIRDVY